ncbi:MAG TPA: M1 family aminopeptidase [Chitinophagaceae bacterium]|nr:M1 family aminopeptidase [Chitinophagaceae bacterium]
MLRKTFYTGFFLLLCLNVRAMENTADSTFYYTLTSVPKHDRTDLEITLRFQATTDTPVVMQLLRDFYGTPQIHKYLTSFTGLNGTVIKETAEPDKKIISPNTKKEISLTYHLSFDPIALRDASYAPNTADSYFHIAACQWMLVAGSLSTPHVYDIRILSPPKGWALYASASDNPSHINLEGSYRQLFNKYWGGGAQAHRQFVLEGKKINVFISEKIKLPQQEVLDAVYRIIHYQRSLFNDHDFPFYTVTILPREDNVAGLRVKNMFMCYVQPDVTPRQLYQLIAHELFHEWLGGRISITEKEEDAGFEHHWLTEGFTDYFACKTLLALKMITPAEFITMINRYIINIADNQFRNYSLQALIDLANKGRYGTEATKLQYYRGALIALDTERDLKRSDTANSLESFIKELYDSTTSARKGISESFLFDFARRRQANLQKASEDNIVHGDSIKLYDDAFGTNYQLKETGVPSFELGFSLGETKKTRKITGLIPGSGAEKAGLKEGMEFLSIENYNRFGNNWRYDRPVIVRVNDNGIEKAISWFPSGKPMTLLLYTAKK